MDTTSHTDTPVPAIAVRGLTKRYGSVVACDSIDLDLHRGQIHGVLGENGAGKSTLMKVLIGLVQPDQGTIELDGVPRRIDDPATADALGIGMVHQHDSLVAELRVWENVVLGDRARFDARRARDLVESISERYGLHVDPRARVGDLTAGLRQRVEIIKCLRRDPRIVIFDEPTSVLTPQESEQLFEVVRATVEGEGRAVALVSHKLAEIRRATDVVSVLRRGRLVESGQTVDFDQRSLARAMVGREVSLRDEAAALGLDPLHPGGGSGEDDLAVPEAPPGTDPPAEVAARTPVLRIQGVAVERFGHRVLDGVDLEVHLGEIVGVAGVEGNGQVELADVLASLLPVEAGTVEVSGRAVVTGRAGAMARAGVAMVPEDRHDAGCVLDLSVADNLALGGIGSGWGFRLVDRVAVRRRAEELIERFEIRCAGPDALFRSLSGGNQQRVVLARELTSNPAVLIAVQPTRGLDVGAIEFVGQQLRAAAGSGIGVLLISSELEELMELSHRILVMQAGRIVGEVPRAEADLERIGLLMGGATATPEGTGS